MRIAGSADPWTIEMVVDLTDAYTRRMEDAKFEAAFAQAA